jgi:hypothetical protein
MLKLSEIGRVAEFEKKSGQIVPFSMNQVLAKFCHDLPRNLNTKVTIHELSFTPVTHTAYSATRFGRYRFLNSGYGAELIPDRTDKRVNFSGLRPKKRESW